MEHVQCITTEWIHVLPGSGKLAAYGGKKKKIRKESPPPLVFICTRLNPFQQRLGKIGLIMDDDLIQFGHI